MKEKHMSHTGLFERELRLKNLNTFIALLGLTAMEMLNLLNLKKASEKSFPFVPIFVFFYAFMTIHTFNYLVLGILSLIIGVYTSTFLGENKNVKLIEKLAISKENKKKKIAKEIGELKATPFILTGLLVGIVLLFYLISLFLSVLFFIENASVDNWIWFILLILSAFPILQISFLLRRVIQFVKKSVKLIFNSQ